MISLASMLLAAIAIPVSAQEPSNHYSDVPSSSYFNVRSAKVVFDSVHRLRDLGVLENTDCGKNQFCPEEAVDRKTLAVWVVRALDGSDAPDFVEGGQGLESRFSDVPGAIPEAQFIERLADLGEIPGCSTSGNLFCPEGAVSRAEVAAFIVEILDLPKAEAINFWDVDKNSRHVDDIDRLVGSEIDDGCSEIRFVPLNYCPGKEVTRGGMARLLSEVIDYVEAEETIKVSPGSGLDNSIGLSVNYNESTKATVVAWGNPQNSRGGVSRFILQWRPTWIGFNYKRYQVVEFNGGGNYNHEFAYAGNGLYSIRVLVEYENGDRVPTSEIKVGSEDHKLRDAVEEQLINPHGPKQPWLIDTWRLLSSSDYSRLINGGSVVSTTSLAHGKHIRQSFARTVSFGTRPDGSISQYSGGGLAVHELAHAYTLTSGITKNEPPIAIGHIYLDILNSEHAQNANGPASCRATELYAALAEIAFFEALPDFDPSTGIPVLISIEKYGGQLNGTYWQGCGFNLDQKTSDEVAKDVKDITKSLFVDQKMPQWFYDRYQSGDAPDLDKLWDDISNIKEARTREIVVYGLKAEFGGYCSEEEVGKFLRGVVGQIGTPWRDSGNCQSTTTKPGEGEQQDEEAETGPSEGEGVETDCSGNIPIVVASDEASQSDRYSAATLAGVLGTDCIILAGGRKQSMPADQRARLDSAKFPGYIVGGTAAVPNSKFIGHPNSRRYSLRRLAGTDRWHTARLVGAEAVVVAGGRSTGSVEASIGAEDSTTDCTGDIPIAVASDGAAQSDRYSAATLAGVLGTDCIVLAGDRDAPFPADQQARLRSAATPGFIVGGTAAVPDTKIAGYDLARIAGSDRWHTARLVGDQARQIAADRPAPSPPQNEQRNSHE